MAQFVVTEDLNQDHLGWLLEKSPAHVIFVLFETPPDMDNNRRHEPLLNVVKDAVASQDRFHYLWTFGGGVLTNKYRMRKARLAGTWTIGTGSSLEVFSIDVCQNYFNPALTFQGAIVYGTGHALLTGDFCGPTFAAVAARQLVKHNVRFLAGVFSDPAKLQNLCDATGRAHAAMFQAWWKPPMIADAQQQVVESDAAVAARLGLESEDDVCKYGLYPAYLIVFGPCRDSTRT